MDWVSHLCIIDGGKNNLSSSFKGTLIPLTFSASLPSCDKFNWPQTWEYEGHRLSQASTSPFTSESKTQWDMLSLTITAGGKFFHMKVMKLWPPILCLPFWMALQIRQVALLKIWLKTINVGCISCLRTRLWWFLHSCTPPGMSFWGLRSTAVFVLLRIVGWLCFASKTVFDVAA